jgi:hypothetical protein
MRPVVHRRDALADLKGESDEKRPLAVIESLSSICFVILAPATFPLAAPTLPATFPLLTNHDSRNMLFCADGFKLADTVTV